MSNIELNIIHHSDALEGLKSLPNGCVNCCVTSPPYWALRNYGVEGQIGMERTPDEYVETMVRVFSEVHRVLADDGTLWINIGDTYYGGKGSNGASLAYSSSNKAINQKALIGTIPGEARPNDLPIPGLKPKDMVGIPWLLAFALRADGWYLRQDIIWSKPNPMPESVNDRCTKSHEYIFLLTKSKKYYFDGKAISEECSPNTHLRISQDLVKQIGSYRSHGGLKANGPMKAVKAKFKQAEPGSGIKNNSSFNTAVCMPVDKRNKRSVWTVTTKGYSEAHFATFPEALIVDCIKAGSKWGGVVLDPFMGAGTTALVARKLNRNFIGFELNPEYIKIANRRLEDQLGLFK